MTDEPNLLVGDCVVRLAEIPAGSVDAVVCDPPYGLEFMGKKWDSFGGDVRQRDDDTFTAGNRRHGLVRHGVGGSYRGDSARSMRAFQAWCEEWASEALRVLKPGGHLVAFGGTRTYHRLTCGLEDAGFEIRDCLAWMFGSGFPKSLNVGKELDKQAGAEREVVGEYVMPLDSTAPGRRPSQGLGYAGAEASVGRPLTAPASDAAVQWDGWGTALKPGFEPIVLARKPLAGTVAGNVVAYGTGALNIDGCRIDATVEDRATVDGRVRVRENADRSDYGAFARDDENETLSLHAGGRWPANVLLDPEAAAILDEQSGDGISRVGAPRSSAIAGEGWGMTHTGAEYDDQGGASRFFYCAKTSRAERNAGLDEFEEHIGKRTQDGGDDTRGRPLPVNRNVHPTVKPIALMRWLARLVTPPGGLIVDPFLGSGTTGIAAVLEGFRFIGIEREQPYMDIAAARIAYWRENGEGALDYERSPEARDAADKDDQGQVTIFEVLT